MIIKSIQDALSKESVHKYEGIDRIPGTDKVITFCATPSGLYSKESDLKTILDTRHGITRQKTLMPPKPTYRQGR